MLRRFKTSFLALCLAALSLIGFIFSNGCCHHLVNSHIGLTIPEQISKHFISIKVIDPRTGINTVVGSGVYIELDGKPQVITAYHVWGLLSFISKLECVSACYKNECACIEPDAIWVGSIDEDWAIVELPYQLIGSVPATLNTELQPIGAPVFAAGNPNGLAVVTHGMIAGYSILMEEPFPHYLVDGYAWFGSSGGGVFDSQGRLIGIMEAIDVFHIAEGSPNPNIYYVVPLREMGPLMD